jgi:D-alanyl-D-alanine carboxypeptidase/D-alanyl-D-alanine-endopeptidase (penicillin-binding protein 4)
MKCLVFFLLFFCLGESIFSQNHIQKWIDTFANTHALKNGQLGVVVLDNSNGDIVASHLASKTIIPASSQKTITTATMLKAFGADFKYETFLEYDGIITDSVLEGNIYITGTGDPTLGSPRMKGTLSLDKLLELFTENIIKLGIKKINGKIIGDASYFESQMANGSWQWADLGNYYAGGVSGLNIHENYYELHFNKASKGRAPSIHKTVPDLQSIKFENELISGSPGSGDNAYIYGSPYDNKRFIRGSIPSGSGTFKIKGSIPNPPLTLARKLREELLSHEISSDTTDYLLYKSTSRKRTLIYTHHSPKLSDIIREAHFRSVNLYCESFIKRLAKKQYDVGEYSQANKVIKAYWSSKGVNVSGVHIQDGSGLSPKNGVTPLFMAQVLRRMASDSVYRETIARAGQSGNLKRKFQGTAAKNNLWAKSGTMSRICSYAGYANFKGKEYSFVIIANNFTCSGKQMRRELDQFMGMLFE